MRRDCRRYWMPMWGTLDAVSLVPFNGHTKEYTRVHQSPWLSFRFCLTCFRWIPMGGKQIGMRHAHHFFDESRYPVIWKR